ncbi:MAG: hypothetical protein NC392_02930 [Roseburia sp.]|nr:hypothetical protein [Roseburia sp.]
MSRSQKECVLTMGLNGINGVYGNGIYGIEGNSYQTDFYAGQAQKNATSTALKNSTAESFASRMENMTGAAKKGHKVYMKTEDMLFSGGYGSGLSFYIKYAETSTEEDPTVVAKGVDENGNEFEQTIHINDINPRSATLVQMHALEAYLGVEKEDGLSSLPKSLGNMGLYDKADFMDLFGQSIRDMSRLGQKRLADYYRYSMQAYADFMANKGKSGPVEKSAGALNHQEQNPVKGDKQESTSDTEIITRPDGSRVLFITMQAGGMKTVTSIALSGPEPLMGELKNVKEAEPAAVPDHSA